MRTHRERRQSGDLQWWFMGRKVDRRLRSRLAVDPFFGAGGLTRGLPDGEIEVIAGYNTDERCR